MLCVDKKSQIQALDRPQPILPFAPGIPERRTYEYLRYGAATLFPALEIVTSKVIGDVHRRHRSSEFPLFPRTIEAGVPPDLDVHLGDGQLRHTQDSSIKAGSTRHPRLQVHFAPTSASWLNHVERWFAVPTERYLRRGTHRSTRQLLEGIEVGRLIAVAAGPKMA